MKKIFLLSLLALSVQAKESQPPPTAEAALALTQDEYHKATQVAPTQITSEEDRLRALIAAKAYFQQKNYTEAASLFTQASQIEAPLGQPEALFYAAEARFRNIEREEARALFTDFIARYPRHRLALRAEARLADILLSLGDEQAALASYEMLQSKKESFLDPSQLLFSTALILQSQGQTERSLRLMRRVWLEFPASPVGREADLLLQENDPMFWSKLQPKERQERAASLFAAMKHEEACALLDSPELASSEEAESYALRGKCALQKKEHLLAGELLFKAAGEDPALWWRAISAYTSATGEARSAGYQEARKLIEQLLQKFPKSKEAQRAEYKAAWLDYHEEKYKAAVKRFDTYLKKFPEDADAQWYTAWSCYLQGDFAGARERLSVLAKNNTILQGNKGKYWLGRVHEQLGERADALKQYKAAIGEWPFSYYAMLSQLRLKALGERVILFEDGLSDAPTVYQKETLAAKVPILETEPGLQEARFWLSIGYQAEAKEALDAALPLLQSTHPKEANLWLCALYQEAGEFKKPLELAWEKDVLKKRPVGDVARWWACGYPRAHELFVVEASTREGISPYLVWSLMRQESSYSPYLVSKADAVGLLQLLPKTAKKVAQDMSIGEFFWADLFKPRENLKLASSYIRRLQSRFEGHLWLTAAAYNGGPGAVGRWLEIDGKRPFDEWVEQISYSESREYLKKVSGHYARYQYLYEGSVYELETTFSTKNNATIVDF
jgi:soluble lytic murein transglycosylase